MKKILIVFGTRPEAIKMAPLVKEFQKHPEKVKTLVCVTAQHRQMLDQVLRLFEITPDYDLNIMQPGQDLYDISSAVLFGMRNILTECKPDLILVHGDTSTSTFSALSAFYQQIPVGHVEAGLRTNNIYSPWPEEMNRQLTSKLASYHFAPTNLSRQNLLDEGTKEETIHVTGNTVIDALYWVNQKIKDTPDIRTHILSQLKNEDISNSLINSWVENNRKLVLITAHRRENFGQGFLNVCEAIKELSYSFPDVDFVFPMHLNPKVRKGIWDVFISPDSLKKTSTNIFFIEPLDYLPFVYLMNVSYLILTDSGGVQEEAPSLGKPVLVMRDTTERPEALAAGTVKLVGTSISLIIREVSNLLMNGTEYSKMSNSNNPYGDGAASARICKILID